MGVAQIVRYAFLVLAAGFLQHSPLLNAFGVKPNLILIALVALSFVATKAQQYIVLLMVGLAVMQFRDAPETELLALGILAFAAFVVGRRLPWRWIFNNGILLAVATVAFYLLTQSSFLYTHGVSVAVELLLNVFTGTLLFLSFAQQRA